jgi:hypothetical protein
MHPSPCAQCRRSHLILYLAFVLLCLPTTLHYILVWGLTPLQASLDPQRPICPSRTHRSLPSLSLHLHQPISQSLLRCKRNYIHSMTSTMRHPLPQLRIIQQTFGRPEKRPYSNAVSSQSTRKRKLYLALLRPNKVYRING